MTHPRWGGNSQRPNNVDDGVDWVSLCVYTTTTFVPYTPHTRQLTDQREEFVLDIRPFVDNI